MLYYRINYIVRWGTKRGHENARALQTAEWNLLEPGKIEHKFYAPGIGLLRAIAVKGESGY